MKNFILLTMVLGLAATTVEAKSVTEEEAMAKAQEWCIKSSNAKSTVSQQPLKLAYKAPCEAKETPSYYVFNYGTDDGYVIVSGDDRTEAILGYAESGTFSEAEMPTSLKWWLSTYSEQIASLKADPNVRPVQVVSNGEAIAPLLTTTWDQSEPYNLMCPINVVDSLEHCVTGCVATAMAQALYYEATTHGGISGYEEIPGYSFQFNVINRGLLTQVVDTLAPRTLNWDWMQPRYTGSETLEDSTAAEVAALMAACGSSVKMEYHTQNMGGSGANSSKIPAALTRYFGFKGETYVAMAKNYTVQGWQDLIYHELSQGRVVIYGGLAGFSGHAFVCDGYADEDFFHFNWGWGGMSDGYYRLTVCSPADQGIGGTSGGYASEQEAVIGFAPEYQKDFTPEVLTGVPVILATDVQVSGETKKYSELKFTTKITNHGTGDYKGTIAFVAAGFNQGFAGLSLAVGDSAEISFYYTPKDTGTIKYSILEIELRDDNNYRQLQSLGEGRIHIDTTTINFYQDFSHDFVVTSPNTGQWGTIEGPMYEGKCILNNANTLDALSAPATIHLFEMIEDNEGYFSGSSVATMTQHVSIPAGGSFEIPFSLGTMKDGVYYMVGLYFTYGGALYTFNGPIFKAKVESTDLFQIEKTSDTESAPAYNLWGQRVDANYRGIVVKNGKKMILR